MVTIHENYTGAYWRNSKLCISLLYYSQTSLIRDSLIRMPHNPNTLPGNLFYFLYDSVIRHPDVSRSEHILMGTKVFG